MIIRTCLERTINTAGMIPKIMKKVPMPPDFYFVRSTNKLNQNQYHWVNFKTGKISFMFHVPSSIYEDAWTEYRNWNTIGILYDTPDVTVRKWSNKWLTD